MNNFILWTTVAVYAATLILQLINVKKYHLTNGANGTRMVLLVVTGSFCTHTVLLIEEVMFGGFYFLGSLFLLFLFLRSYRI